VIVLTASADNEKHCLTRSAINNLKVLFDFCYNIPFELISNLEIKTISYQVKEFIDQI